MKLIIPIFLLFILASCQPSDKYYISKDFDFTTDHYILAEKKGDSVQLWHLANNVNSGFGLISTETLPFDLVSSYNFKIENITNNYLIVNGKTLRRVHNFKRYFKLRNEITAEPIESDYKDSVRKILGMGNTAIALLPVQDDTKDKLVSNTHCDSFAKKYRDYLQSKLPAMKADAASKKALYTRAIAGRLSLDSTTFKHFIDNYNHGYYDRKLAHHFFTHNPKLFFLEIDFFGLELDINCYDCFTKQEREEMYCKLEPFSSKDPRKLRDIFRQEPGEVKCQE